jgi:hypothetical protein
VEAVGDGVLEEAADELVGLQPGFAVTRHTPGIRKP